MRRVELFGNVSSAIENLAITPRDDMVPSGMNSSRIGALHYENGKRLPGGSRNTDFDLFDTHLLTASVSPQKVGPNHLINM